MERDRIETERGGEVVEGSGKIVVEEIKGDRGKERCEKVF